MIITRRLQPTQKENLWIVPGSKTILEEICGHNKERIFWLSSKPWRSLHVVQGK